jgi:hypothetical protein
VKNSGLFVHIYESSINFCVLERFITHLLACVFTFLSSMELDIGITHSDLTLGIFAILFTCWFIIYLYFFHFHFLWFTCYQEYTTRWHLAPLWSYSTCLWSWSIFRLTVNLVESHLPSWLRKVTLWTFSRCCRDFAKLSPCCRHFWLKMCFGIRHLSCLISTPHRHLWLHWIMLFKI